MASEAAAVGNTKNASNIVGKRRSVDECNIYAQQNTGIVSNTKNHKREQVDGEMALIKTEK